MACEVARSYSTPLSIINTKLIKVITTSNTRNYESYPRTCKRSNHRTVPKLSSAECNVYDVAITTMLARPWGGQYVSPMGWLKMIKKLITAWGWLKVTRMFAPMGLTCCPPHGLTTAMLRFVSPTGHTLRPPHGGWGTTKCALCYVHRMGPGTGGSVNPWALTVNVLNIHCNALSLSE